MANFFESLNYLQSVLHQVQQANFGVEICSSSSFLLGVLGAVFGVVFANVGAAVGLAQSFAGYIELCKNPRTDKLMMIKGLIPGVMASVRGVYGLIIAILIVTQLKFVNYTAGRGFAHLFSGVCVGFSGVASGWAMGVVGDEGLKSVAVKPVLFTSFLLILVFC